MIHMFVGVVGNGQFKEIELMGDVHVYTKADAINKFLLANGAKKHKDVSPEDRQWLNNNYHQFVSFSVEYLSDLIQQKDELVVYLAHLKVQERMRLITLCEQHQKPYTIHEFQPNLNFMLEDPEMVSRSPKVIEAIYHQQRRLYEKITPEETNSPLFRGRVLHKQVAISLPKPIETIQVKVDQTDLDTL